MAKIKKYSITMESDVYAISLVEAGAIESDFVFLAKQQPKQVCLEKNEKHLVIGAILIPDRPIYRYDEEIGEYYISFSKEVIEKLAYDFMKRKLNDSVTLDHESDANNISLVESWLRISENDKSVELGLDAPLGSWIGAMKVEDEATWERIKNQELNGFSVEAFCNLEEFKLSKTEDNKMEENKTLLEQIKEIIFEALGKNETVEETIENTVVEEQTEEVIETEVTNETVEVSEEVVEETVDVVEETVEVVEEAVALEEVKNPLEDVVAELNAQIATLNEEIENLKKENTKLSKQPSVKPIKANMAEDAKTPYERMMAIYKNNAK